MEIIPDSGWIQGLDSMSYTLGQGFYTWAQNVVNRGGLIQTRQGLAEIAAVADQDPRGAGAITIGGVTWLLVAIGDGIYKLNLNNPDGLIQLKYPGTNNFVKFPIGNRRYVHFELCVQAQYSTKVIHGGVTSYETHELPTPKFVLIIQDGATVPHYWDGTKCDKVDNLYPDTVPNNTPKGAFMKWVGDRLWTVSGRKMKASNLLNPFQNTEELVTASGGFFFLPDTATGMGVTHDYKQLLVYTHFTTSAFQAGLEDRTLWPNTQDFQRVIFPSIGCVSHRTIINKYGMTWWMSQDGWVGLDNALSAYQSSRLDVQDHNMSRSKEGINWSTGGGCAGSYDNFLFVSVPSSNKWNQHTWVMDQAPINTLSGATPPAWPSNWTGIRPEQWITCQVRGQQRCFCISRDLVNDEGHQATVWEAFIGQRMDVPKVNDVRKAKDIGCAFEQRFVGLSPSQYMKLRWIEVDCAEIVGDVALQVFYCGRRTSYKRIINTHLTATVSSDTEEILNPDDPLPVYVPQYRTVRSYTDTHSTEDNDTGIQTPYLRNMDREFSVLVQWSGQMAVAAIRLAVDPEPDYMEGTDFQDEYLSRRLTAEGTGDIGCTLPPPNAPNNQLTSKFLAPLKPRWVEFPAYDSAVPNGVFFVGELTADPPPGDYPSSNYPIEVTLTSETQDINIYYTRTGGTPHGPPHQVGTLYPPKPSMSIGQTLRAVGERDHMQPSVLLQGRYTQSKCGDVTFDPPPGGYPPEDFAQPNPEYLGPVASYNFNEGTGSAVHDSGPYDIDGTAYHTTWNNSGKHGKALNFNGTTGNVFIGNQDLLHITRAMSVSAWVKATADPSSTYGGIVSKSDGTSGWALKTINDGGNQKFAISIHNPNGAVVTRHSATVRALNTWYHVAGVYRDHLQVLDIYVNGVLNNGTLTGIVRDHQVDAPTGVTIGRNQTFYFAGVIDDVRIYPRSQTQAEVAADMNVGVHAPDPVVTGFAVTMTCPTPEATIHFNLSDAPVTEDQDEYDPAHPPHPYADTVIRAKAFKQYYLPGNEERGRYFAKERCATPTLDPEGDDYPPEQYNPTKTITVATTTAGATLRYTINSTDFDADGHNINANHGTVEVHLNDTLRVIAKKANFIDSHTKAGTYTSAQVQVETPVISPNEVVVTDGTHEYTVDVSCNTPNSVLYYEIMDGNQNINPTHSSPHINDSQGRITVDQIFGHRKLRVLAAKVGLTDSEISEAIFDWEHGGGQ